MPVPLTSFAPISHPDARLLVLGSMPGEASLRAGQYYAHPRNAFWPIMGALVGADPALPYAARVQRLRDRGIAVWDVLRHCERPGSLDSAIRVDGAEANDFAAFLGAHAGIGTLLFNGAAAERLFQRLVAPLPDAAALRMRRMPSTSPANASQRIDAKLEAWRGGLRDGGVLAE
jgi:TDG/mug DNA glycosylase family protein